jgi:hypothetical protein
MLDGPVLTSPWASPSSCVDARRDGGACGFADRLADASKALLPYTNFRKGIVDTTGRDVPLTVQVIRFGDMTSKPEPVMIEHDSNEAA